MARTVFIIASTQDRAAADALEDQIEAAGGVAEMASPSASDPLWLDAMAARMKEADAAALVASSAGRDDRDMRRALYLALLYDKPLAVGAIGDAGLDALLDDGDLFIGTRHESDPSAFGRDLSGAISIGSSGGDGWIDDAADLDAAAMKRLADRASALAAAAPQPSGRARDALGFPHTPASMMARWRILDQQDDMSAYELFREDYGDDPYFGPKVDDVLAGYRRARRRGGVSAVWSGLVGVVAAAMMFAAYASVCVGGNCGTAGVGLLTASAGDLPETDDVDELRDQNLRLRATLAAARAELATTESELDRATERAEDAERRVRRLTSRIADLESDAGAAITAAGADAADVELELASAVAQFAEARQRADGLERRLSELRARNGALEEENVSLRDENAELTAALEARGRRAPEPRGASITISGDVGGATRLLAYYLERLDDENAVRSESDFAELIGTAMLRRLDFAILQSCVVSETSLLLEADGLWGARTTEAFLRMDSDEAGDVIACVERDAA